MSVYPGDEAPKVYGVKSFEHATDRLEDQCVQVLNLLPHFEQRQIRPDSDWETVLYPALKSFLLEAAKSGERLRLIFDAHLTLAFAAGSVLDIKSGRVIELVRRTLGKSVWAADDAAADSTWPQWSFTRKELSDVGSDIAVAVGLTHSIAGAVEAYVSKSLPSVGKLGTDERTRRASRDLWAAWFRSRRVADGKNKSGALRDAARRSYSPFSGGTWRLPLFPWSAPCRPRTVDALRV